MKTTPKNPNMTLSCSADHAQQATTSEENHGFSVVGFCDCDDDRCARGIAVATKLMVWANLCFFESNTNHGGELDFLHVKSNGDVFATYEFVIATGQWCGLTMLHAFKVSTIQSWPALCGDVSELERMVNSAANILPSDTSEQAQREREASCMVERGALKLISDMAIAIEVGLHPDGSGRNCMTRIIEPDDPEYLDVMKFEHDAIT